MSTSYGVHPTLASSTQSSSLLALPLELRLKIYEQLLSPDPERVYTLYHDRHGRGLFSGRRSAVGLAWDKVGDQVSKTGRNTRHFERKGITQSAALRADAECRNSACSIDPTILQVNKKIYSEAVGILYTKNRYRISLETPVVTQCTGGNYSDLLPDPPGLFRGDATKVAQMAVKLDRTLSSCLSEDSKPSERSRDSEVAIIYPRCFQRLQRIHLVTAHHSIWEQNEEGDLEFTHIGRTIWKILRVLVDEEAAPLPSKKHLKVTIGKHWLEDPDACMTKRHHLSKQTLPILGLMKALQRRTAMEIEIEIEDEEETFSRSLREIWMGEIEVDRWEQVLKADLTVTIDGWCMGSAWRRYFNSGGC